MDIPLGFLANKIEDFAEQRGKQTLKSVSEKLSGLGKEAADELERQCLVTLCDVEIVATIIDNLVAERLKQ